MNLRVNPRTSGLACAVALLLSACDEPILPLVTDAGAHAGDSARQPAGPALQEAGIPRFDPKRARRTPEQAAKAVEKIKSGENFTDIEIMPEVKVASQRVADEVVVKPTSLAVPVAGNEALLALKPGAVLVSGAAQATARRGSKGDNVSASCAR